MSDSKPCGFKGCLIEVVFLPDRKNPWGRDGLKINANTGRPHYHNFREDGRVMSSIPTRVLNKDAINKRKQEVRNKEKEIQRRHPRISLMYFVDAEGRVPKWGCQDCKLTGSLETLLDHYCNLSNANTNKGKLISKSKRAVREGKQVMLFGDGK